MTGCPSMKEVNAFLDGELPPKRELELRWHLDLCGACVRSAAGVAALKRAVGRSGRYEAPSPALRRNVTAARIDPPH